MRKKKKSRILESVRFKYNICLKISVIASATMPRYRISIKQRQRK